MATARWLPPRLHTSQEGGEERKVTWLELFYDLVYVATFIQLGNWLGANVSWSGVLGFAGLFIPIWWSWTGLTFYVNRFVVDDVWYRLLIFIQMFAIGALAISVDEAFGAEAARFALAYVAIRAVLIVLYVRAGRYVPAARALTSHYAIGFTGAAAIWLLSAFVPSPANYWLWALGMIVDFAVPLSAGTRHLSALLPPDVAHMSERYGLLTLIVLGESFVKVLSTATGTHVDLTAALHGLLGLVVACSLWWLYFDHVAGAHVPERGLRPYVWIYSHLPLTIGLIAYGVAITKLVVLHADQPFADKYRLLIAGSVAVALVFIALIELVTTPPDGAAGRRRRIALRFSAAGLILLLGFSGGLLDPTLFLGLVALLCAVQIVHDLRTEALAGPAAGADGTLEMGEASSQVGAGAKRSTN